MREIKAYIQRSRLNALVEKLQESGAPGMTVVEVHPVGDGYEPNYFELHFEKDVLKRYEYLEVVKIELVCTDEDVDRFVGLIQSECRTGQRGDGWIFVSEVEQAIRIRDGQHLHAAA